MMEGRSSYLFDLMAGIMVLFLASIFILYSYNIVGVGNGWISEKYRVFGVFSQVDGLKKGADVRLSGIKVGNVISQKLEQDFRVKVEMVIDDSVALSDDTIARVTSVGLFGELYISLEPGGRDVFLKDGEEIFYTKGSVDIIGLFLRSMLMGGEN